MHSYLKNGTAACRYSSSQPGIKDAQLQYQQASVANSTASRSTDRLESLMYNSQMALMFCHMLFFSDSLLLRSQLCNNTFPISNGTFWELFLNIRLGFLSFFLYFACIFLCYKGFFVPLFWFIMEVLLYQLFLLDFLFMVSYGAIHDRLL